MAKNPSKTPESTSILKTFIEKEDAKTTSGKIKQIQAITTLNQLVHDANKYHNKDQKVTDAYTKRAEEIADDLLLQENDVYRLISLCLYDYGHWEWSAPLLYEKVWNRIQLVLTLMNDIDELLVIREKIGKEYWPKDRYYIFNAFENHMVEVASTHKKRKSFPFLMSIWNKMSPGLPSCEKLALLMPEALSSEKDIPTLKEYYGKTFNNWNHHDNGAARAVETRIQERLNSLIPYTKDLEKLSWYRNMGNLKNKAKAEKKLRQITQIHLRTLHTVKEISLYQKKFKYISWDKDAELRFLFEARANKVLPSVLEKITNAEEAYVNMELLAGLFFNTAFKRVHDKFLLLAPVYFETNHSIEKEILWNQLFENNESWNKIVQNVVSKQKDLNLLAKIITKNKVEKVTSLAKEQLEKLILKLTKPNQFFLDCIQDGKFFDRKNIFIEKAKKFAS